MNSINDRKKIILDVYLKLRNLILYAVFGSISAGLDFGVFSLITQVYHINYLFANVLSVSIGIFTSFLLNKTFNFRVKDKTIKRFLIFVSVGLMGLLLSSALLFVFVEMFKFDKTMSKLMSIFLVVILQFLLNKFITFKKYSYE